MRTGLRVSPVAAIGGLRLPKKILRRLGRRHVFFSDSAPGIYFDCRSDIILKEIMALGLLH